MLIPRKETQRHHVSTFHRPSVRRLHPYTATRQQQYHAYDSYYSSYAQPQSTRLTSVASATATAVAATTQPPLLSQFVMGFLAGGVVCSAAMLAAITYASYGQKNFRRILAFRRTVLKHVLGIFWFGLGAAKATLLRDSQWNWKEAWKVVRESFKETKRAAQEGVEAIRLESNLYAAAVGKPGLGVFQYAVNHLTPKLLAQIMEDSLRDTLGTVQDSYVDNIELVGFAMGDSVPELLDARAYELGNDAMAFDLDVRWRSDVEASMSLKTKTPLSMTLPVMVRNFDFDGVVRVVLSPLTPEPPGFGAALISLPTTPRIGLDVSVAGGEIMNVPWLRSEILSTLQKCIEDQFLWPRRLVVPSAQPPQRHKKVKTMLSQEELQTLEHDDPLLRAEEKLAQELDGLHHQVPPPEHRPVITTQEDVAIHTEIQLKDSDCLDALEEGQEELCIIDWDSFEVASSSPESSKEQTVVEETFLRP